MEHRGAERAEAVLLHFHGTAPWDVTSDSIPSIFVEMAKAANWDILRINRYFCFDKEEHDNDMLRFVADRVAELRREGYRKVIVGGGSSGGWLSLLASAMPGIDAAIALAPGTRASRSELLRTGKKLERILANARAPRIAVFFFAGDEALEIRRSYMIRNGLEKSASTFTIIDHPLDLDGHEAMLTGRLARGYRDCLVKLVHDPELPVGEIECSRSIGVSVDSDTRFPWAAGSLGPPPDVNPAFLSPLGRWEGDDRTRS